MGCGKCIANMILSKHDILKQSQYVISYDFQSQEKTGVVNINLGIPQTVGLKYNENLHSFCTNWGNQTIICPKYVAVSLGWLTLIEICEYYKYPPHLIMFKHDGNTKTSFLFDILESEEEMLLAMYAFDFTSKLIQNGLRRDIIDMAKKLNIWEGCKIVCNSYLGVKIE